MSTAEEQSEVAALIDRALGAPDPDCLDALLTHRTRLQREHAILVERHRGDNRRLAAEMNHMMQRFVAAVSRDIGEEKCRRIFSVAGGDAFEFVESTGESPSYVSPSYMSQAPSSGLAQSSPRLRPSGFVAGFVCTMLAVVSCWFMFRQPNDFPYHTVAYHQTTSTLPQGVLVLSFSKDMIVDGERVGGKCAVVKLTQYLGHDQIDTTYHLAPEDVNVSPDASASEFQKAVRARFLRLSAEIDKGDNKSYFGEEVNEIVVIKAESLKVHAKLQAAFPLIDPAVARLPAQSLRVEDALASAYVEVIRGPFECAGSPSPAPTPAAPPRPSINSPISVLTPDP